MTSPHFADSLPVNGAHNSHPNPPPAAVTAVISCAYVHHTWDPVDLLLDHRFPTPGQLPQERSLFITQLPTVLCERALDAVIELYDFVVRQEVPRVVTGPDMSYAREDFYQEGRVLLLRAARTFSPRRSTSGGFTTYASTCVRHGLIKVHRWLQRDHERLTSAMLAGTILSADHEGNVHTSAASLSTAFEDPAAHVEATAEAAFVRSLVATLSPRHQLCLQLAYVDDWSLRQIADYVELSRTRVHQILQEGLHAVREQYLADYLGSPDTRENKGDVCTDPPLRPPTGTPPGRPTGCNGANGVQRGERGATGKE